MKSLSYILLAYIAVGLQIAVAGVMRYGIASPNLVMLAVIFLALNAPREPALLGGFMLGLLCDLVTQQPLGLSAFTMSIVAVISNAAARVAYRGHPLTHFSLALTGGIICTVFVWLNSFIHLPREVRPTLIELSKGALYSAVLAPLVIGILHRIRSVFGFTIARKRLV